MRLELHIVHWSVALVAAALAAVHRPAPVPAPDSPVSGRQLTAALVTPADPETDVSPAPLQAGRSERPLFRTPVSRQAQVPVVAAAPPPEIPILKGIVETANGRKAVFAAGGLGGPYLVIGAGEVIGTFHVEHVTPDGVVVRDFRGELIRLALRGSGESPE